MFKKHDKDIDAILNFNSDQEFLKKSLVHHKYMIELIQHERLIHLLVTIFVGITMSIASMATIVSANPILGILDIPLIILFTAYIFHYRFLENTTQKWYSVALKIEDKIHN